MSTSSREANKLMRRSLTLSGPTIVFSVPRRASVASICADTIETARSAYERTSESPQGGSDDEVRTDGDAAIAKQKVDEKAKISNTGDIDTILFGDNLCWYADYLS